jgi:hypothetical protein
MRLQAKKKEIEAGVTRLVDKLKAIVSFEYLLWTHLNRGFFYRSPDFRILSPLPLLRLVITEDTAPTNRR